MNVGTSRRNIKKEQSLQQKINKIKHNFTCLAAIKEWIKKPNLIQISWPKLTFLSAMLCRATVAQIIWKIK